MTASTDSGKSNRYWRNNLRLIGILLAIWGIVTFIPAYFAVDLAGVMFFGWPFPFWVAAFGAPTAFLIIVGVYAWRMDDLDRQARATRVADGESDRMLDCAADRHRSPS